MRSKKRTELADMDAEKESCYALAFYYGWLLELGLHEAAEIINDYLKNNPQKWKYYADCLWIQFGLLAEYHMHNTVMYLPVSDG